MNRPIPAADWPARFSALVSAIDSCEDSDVRRDAMMEMDGYQCDEDGTFESCVTKFVANASDRAFQLIVRVAFPQ